MRKLIIVLSILLTNLSFSQTIDDLFKASEVKVSWLGIDFSHIKLIGDFAQFESAGMKNPVEIRDLYFPKWNKLILNEPDKYDVGGMVRKSDVFYDVESLMSKNAKTATEELEAYNNPNYSDKEIKSFVKEIKLKNKDGIGMLFLAECFNKTKEEAYFHFIVIDMKNKNILFHERLRGEPRGFGIRNYWAGAIHDVIDNIEKVHYRNWKSNL